MLSSPPGASIHSMSETSAHSELPKGKCYSGVALSLSPRSVQSSSPEGYGCWGGPILPAEGAAEGDLQAVQHQGCQTADWLEVLQNPVGTRPEPHAVPTEREAESMPVGLKNGDYCDSKSSKLVTSDTRKIAPIPSAVPEGDQCPGSRQDVVTRIHKASKLVVPQHHNRTSRYLGESLLQG